MAERLAPGTEVEWTSQSGGVDKTKKGTILAFVPANDDVRKYWKAEDYGATRGLIKFDYRVSQNPRYIVAVPRPRSKQGKVDYYAPLARWLEK